MGTERHGSLVWEVLLRGVSPKRDDGSSYVSLTVTPVTVYDPEVARRAGLPGAYELAVIVSQEILKGMITDQIFHAQARDAQTLSQFIHGPEVGESREIDQVLLAAYRRLESRFRNHDDGLAVASRYV
jgi:hypothetical protein